MLDSTSDEQIEQPPVQLGSQEETDRAVPGPEARTVARPAPPSPRRVAIVVVVGVLGLILGTVVCSISGVFFFGVLESYGNTQMAERAARTYAPTETAMAERAISTATAAQSALKAVDGWKLLLTDNFYDNKNGWPIGDGKSIADGKYTWDFSHETSAEPYRGFPQMQPLSDFAASIDVRQVSGSLCGMGMTFRNSGRSDYVIYVYEGLLFFPPYSYPVEESGTIVPGARQRITVIAQGEHFTFFVNGKYVSQAKDATSPQGKIGVMVSKLADPPCQVEFSNFEVRVP